MRRLSYRLGCIIYPKRCVIKRFLGVYYELGVSVLGNNKIAFAQADPFIFMEIAGQHDLGRADIPHIRAGVDYRQKMLLSDSELRSGLERLQKAGIIIKRGDRYFVSASVAPSLPRTSSGQLSFRREGWDKMRKRLFNR